MSVTKTIKLAGQTVPAVGIGTWHLGETPDQRFEELAALRTGIAAGARVIDTAEMYGNGAAELLVREAIQGLPRDQLFLISKVLPSYASKTELEAHLDASLARLETNYLDLYLYHWRGSIPLNETVQALEQMVVKGKIRAWGVSNFDTSDMQELWSLPNGRHVAANQDLYNLGDRGIDFDLVPWLHHHDIPLIAYSPTGQGDARGYGLTQSPVVRAIAQDHHLSTFQLLLAWTIRQSGTLTIPKAGTVRHMAENIAAATVTLTPAEVRALDAAFPAPTTKQPLGVI